MTASALAMVLVAAFLHAIWNYLAKKSLNKIAFIWWAILFSIILFFPMFVITLLLFTPYVLVKVRSDLKKEWRIHKIEILIVGFLDLFTYMLILFALRISKVSYVAAVREVSIVFSTITITNCH